MIAWWWVIPFTLFGLLAGFEIGDWVDDYKIYKESKEEK